MNGQNETCGAKNRQGKPCQRRDIFKNGRCKLHGGLSTGPKTLEGKRKSALNIGKDYDELAKSKIESNQTLSIVKQ